MLFTAMPVVKSQTVQSSAPGVVRRRTLRDELGDQGVRVISSAQVRAYQKQAVEKERAKGGAWKKFWMLAYLMQSSVMFQRMFIASFFVSLVGVWFAWMVSFVVWDASMVILVLQSVIVYYAEKYQNNLMFAGAHWERVPVADYPGWIAPDDKEICSTAQQLSGVQVFVESLNTDPFMIARRVSEECVIAFWDAPGFNPDG